MNYQEFFLDYFNNYLTVAKIAEHYGITEAEARYAIDVGRDIHESQFDS